MTRRSSRAAGGNDQCREDPILGSLPLPAPTCVSCRCDQFWPGDWTGARAPSVRPSAEGGGVLKRGWTSGYIAWWCPPNPPPPVKAGWVGRSGDDTSSILEKYESPDPNGSAGTDGRPTTVIDLTSFLPQLSRRLPARQLDEVPKGACREPLPAIDMTFVYTFKPLSRV